MSALLRDPTHRRVLYLLRYHPTLTETFVYREIQALEELGYDVEIGTLGPRADGALQDIALRARVHTPPQGPLRSSLLRSLAPSLLDASVRDALRSLRRDRPLRRALDALFLARLACEYPWVHVHFCGEAAEWALAARRMGGPPYTVMVHAVDLFKPRRSMAELLRGATRVFTISEYNRVLLRERYAVDATLLRCGVPIGELRATPSTAPLRVVAVGRFVPKKGFELLIQAIECACFPVTLTLVSDIPRSFESDRVRVLGLLPPAQVRELLLGASLLALPCRRAPDGDMDGIPVVLMEAMALGLPVLSTRLGGIPELVDEKVGWLVEPDSVEALVQALGTIAQEPEERQRRGSRGPGRLQERGFTLSAQVARLIELWGEAP